MLLLLLLLCRLRLPRGRRVGKLARCHCGRCCRHTHTARTYAARNKCQKVAQAWQRKAAPASRPVGAVDGQASGVGTAVTHEVGAFG